jgi:ABC-type multidrug transport system fused ATPase/permease subunit
MRATLAAIVRRARGYLAGYERRFILLGVVAIVAGVLEASVLVIVVPLVQGIAEDQTHIGLDVPGFEGPYGIGSLFAIGIALVVVRLGVQIDLARRRAGLLADWDAQLRRRVFHSYLDADWALQSHERGTHIQELLTGHLGASQLILGALTSGWIATFSLLVLLAAALVVNPAGALLIVVFAVGMSLLLRPLARRSRALTTRLAAANLEYVQEIGDASALAREIRVFDASEATRDRFDQQVDHIAGLRRRVLTLGGSVPAIYQNLVVGVVLGGLATIFILVPSQLASLAVVVLVLIRAMSYSQSVHASYQQLNEGGPYFERILANEARYLAEPRRTGGDPIERLDVVAFESATYTYPADHAEEAGTGRTAEALHDLDLVLRRGTLVGVVGPSGAGKSTFVQLLLGLRDPTEGRITADGTDLRALDGSAWFSLVSVVPQEPLLLATTVFDNIAFRRPGTSPADVERAARRAHVHDEIMSWPDGYQTTVGERGGKVSGGQRQRICIARALVGDPQLVIFDEPTSALDPQSEHRVQQTLAELREEALVVVVAHRLSTLDTCDEIVVLRDGHLLAHGPAPEVRRDDPWVAEAMALGAPPPA